MRDDAPSREDGLIPVLQRRDDAVHRHDPWQSLEREDEDRKHDHPPEGEVRSQGILCPGDQRAKVDEHALRS